MPKKILQKKYLRFWPVGVILLAYIIIASIRLNKPGVHYDEALFLNSALGGVDASTFITKSFHGIPVLLMPYIGALKSYIFYPIFKIFGVTAITMRFPAILLTAAALWLLYKMITDRFGRLLALGVLASTALSASFLIFTRLDFGPVVLDFLIKIMALLALCAFIENQRFRYLVSFWILMFAGTFNKLNFIWYVNAFFGAFVLVYGWRIWRKSSSALRWRYLLISAAGFLLNIGYYLYINATYHLGSSFGFIGIQYLYHTLSTVVDGSWFYSYAFSGSKLGNPLVFWAMLVVIILGMVLTIRELYFRKTRDKKQAHFFAFIGIALLLLIAELAMTKQATAGWHYFSIYPLWNILFVLSLSVIASVALPRKAYLQRAAIILVVAVSCLYQLLCYSKYIQAYNKPTVNPGWSSSIYSLIDFTKAHPNPVVSLDWGLQTQLIGFDAVPNKYYEVFGPISLQGDGEAQNYRDYIVTKPNAYYVTHSTSIQTFPEVTRDFFKLSQNHGLHPVLVKTISDGCNPIFQVYQLKQQ